MTLPPSAIVGILLCGGRGSRFDPSGQKDKLLQRLPKGASVAFESASRLRACTDRVIAVLRPDRPALESELRSAGCEIVICEDAATGMSATLRAGIAASADAPAWLVALADMPFVHASTLLALRQALQCGQSIVAPVHAGRRGNPVGFAQEHRAALLQLQGDAGARSLLQSQPVYLVEVDDPGIHRDIDTPADLPAPDQASC